MSVAKLNPSNGTDILILEGNDPVGTLVKQSIVKDPFISLPKDSGRPVQWIQLLQALDQPDLPGWPLLSPVKVQMQKCDKCSREFFSLLNCRRHIRVNHRLKNLDKDTGKNRELLAAFWNKLSTEEAKEIVSFKNLTLEGVPGATIIKNLASLILRPGFLPLPQACSRAGEVLLDIIQARPSTFPISAQELFGILDDASEKTFLSGPALSMQKYIFDGEATKIGLEGKNLVACTSFFLEQQMIKAWMADKDAEALICQKLLVEEEEAAQRKQAELLERKRRKKLRQKARDVKVEEESGHFYENSDSSKDGPFAESSGNFTASVSETPLLDEAANEEDLEAQTGLGFNCIDPDLSENTKQQQLQDNSNQNFGKKRWKIPSRSCDSSCNFQGSPHPRASRTVVKQSHEMRAAPTVHTGEIRSWKLKPDNNEIVKLTVRGEVLHRDGQNKKWEVLIGSIPVTIESCNQLQVRELEGQDDVLALTEYSPSKRNISQKIFKDDYIQLHTNPGPQQNSERSDDCQIFTAESCLPASAPGIDCCIIQNCSQVAEPERSKIFPFSSCVAKDFLARRWKEAIAGDHVKLVLLPESDLEGSLGIQNSPQEISNYNNGVAVDYISSESGKANSGVKPAASLKKRYVPKIRAAT